MLSLLEDRWDDLMTFDPQLFGQAGTVSSYKSDPSQKFSIRSTMPKSTPPKKLEQIQNQESESHLMELVYAPRSCQQYLKVNSANPKCPLTMFLVSGRLHSTIVKSLDKNALYLASLVVSDDSTHISDLNRRKHQTSVLITGCLYVIL